LHEIFFRGDRGAIFDYLLNTQLSFIVRLKKTRDLMCKGGKHPVLELAMTCPLPYAERIVKQEKGKETIYDLQFGARAVKLPGNSQPLTLVVVRGFGQEPLMLLTDLRVTRNRKSLWRILESYPTRWRIEETIRFMKQSYQVEDIRLLTYHRPQNMMEILTAVAYFAMVYLGLRTKLRVFSTTCDWGCKAGVRDTGFSLLCPSRDGIREYLFGRQKGLQAFFQHWVEEHNQLCLFDP
jgi:hypothetical protein